jgi:hypothetical protein
MGLVAALTGLSICRRTRPDYSRKARSAGRPGGGHIFEMYSFVFGSFAVSISSLSIKTSAYCVYRMSCTLRIASGSPRSLYTLLFVLSVTL